MDQHDPTFAYPTWKGSADPINFQSLLKHGIREKSAEVLQSGLQIYLTLCRNWRAAGILGELIARIPFICDWRFGRSKSQSFVTFDCKNPMFVLTVFDK